MALTKVQTIGIETGISLTGVTTVTTLNASTDTLSVGGTVNFGGNVSIAGTLTYEDVTNIDSVGIITARSGINVTGGDVGIGLTNPEDYGNFADDLVIYDSSQPGMTFASGTSGYGSIYFADGTTGNAASRGQIQYGHSDDYMAFATAATERLRIDSSGRLLLGITSSAGGTLQVNGGIRVAGSGSPSDATSPYIYRTSGADNLCISTDGTERMRIDSSGRLLLGTTTEGVGQSDDLTVATSGDTGITVRSGTSSNGNLFFSDGTSGADEYRGYVQYDHSVNELIFGSDATARMRLDSSGRLLIGGTNTYHANADNLVVQGTGQIGVTIASTSTGKSNLFFADSTSNPGTYACYFEYDHSVDALKIGQGNNERIRIDSSGNMGLGTNSPSNNIHLKRTGANAILRIENTGNGNHSGIFFVREASSGTSKGAANIHVESNTGGTGTALIFGCGSNTSATGGERMRLNSSGNFGIGLTDPSQPLHVDCGAPSSSDKIIAQFQSESARQLYIGWDDSQSTMAIGTNNNHALCFHINGQNAERMRIDTSGRLLVGATSDRSSWNNTTIGANILQVERAGNANAAAISVTANSGTSSPTVPLSAAARLLLGRSRGTSVGSDTLVASGDVLGDVSFQGNDGGGFVEAAAIQGFCDGTPGSNDMPGRLVFKTTANGAASSTERMRITHGGIISIADAFSSIGTPSSGVANGGILIRPTTVQDNTPFLAESGTTSNSVALLFANPNGVRGSIVIQSGSTVYNTTSDYRLKENVIDLDGAIDRVKQLAPKRFNFINDEKTIDGFLAHEAATVVPESVTGTRDEIDAKGKPVYQGIDTSKLVPLLTAALQEEIAKREALEARIAALEG